MTDRRGHSLIEMIVVIASASIMMTIAIGTLHTLMRSERQGAMSLVYSVGMARLAEQLRDDVRAATAAEPSEGGSKLRLTMPGGLEIFYARVGEDVIRSEKTAQKTTRREAYRIPAGTGARFSAEPVEESTAISLELVRADAGKQSKSTLAAQVPRRRMTPLRFEAVLAKDHRFTEASP